MSEKEPGYYYKKSKNAIKRWNDKHAEIKLRLPHEQKERWRAAADAAGESLTAFIAAAVETRIAGKGE